MIKLRTMSNLMKGQHCKGGFRKILLLYEISINDKIIKLSFMLFIKKTRASENNK
jgi:hypothetical protein